MNKVKVFKRHVDAKIPSRNKKNDAGLDIYSIEDKFISVGSTELIKTGISIQVPEGYVGKIEDRSSMALKGLRTGAGVVDSGFSGELGIVLHNLTNTHNSVSNVRGYQINKGDKIAQILLYKVETPEVEEVEEIWNSERSSNGFGSSGR